MDLKDAIRVEFERVFREALHEMHRSLRVVLDPLEDWARDIIQRPLASDWREQLAAHLATWDAEGFRLADESVPVLESWIEAWATYLAPMHARNAAAVAGAQQQEHGFVISFAPNVGGPPNGQAAVKLSQQSSVVRDGVEVAGPGPETSESFRRKVHYALELLDPSVANWWKTPSVAGILRARDASSGTQFWRWNYCSYMEGERPVVVVDQNFTAAQAAEAIVAESEQGYFADSVAVARRRFKAGRSDVSKVLQEWQKAGLGDAAEMAGILAELLITSIATLTPAGDLVVTLADLIENGPSWDQLISVLPLIGKLPILAVVVRVGNRNLKLPKSLLDALARLNPTRRKRLLSQVNHAKTDSEAVEILRRGLGAAAKGPGEWRSVVEAMSERARAYQAQITGRTGEAYFVNGVKFDGFTDGKLLDAKGPGYKSFTKEADFRRWFHGKEGLRSQAVSQVRAAAGMPIEWHVAEPEFAAALKKLFAKEAFGITIVHTPHIP